MSHKPEGKVGDLRDFKWGIKKGVGMKNKGTIYYESFVYEGVEYFLYDCAYFYHINHVETSIGKLVKMFEKPTHEKMVKVVWLLRPSGIRNFLGDYQPRWNELFLASGAGEGVSNISHMHSIIGKCNVVCTSKDKRNPEPSETELKMADYFFRCTFDVGRLTILHKFADEIDQVEVERFFNRKGDKKTSNPLQVGTSKRPKIMIKARTDPSDMLRCQVEDKAEVRTSENVLPKSSLHSFPYKKRKIMDEMTIGQSSKFPKDKEFDEKVTKHKQDKRVDICRKVTKVTKRPDAIVDEKPPISQSSKCPKYEEFNDVAKTRPDKRDEKCRKAIEVTERPEADKIRWFKDMPWDERLQIAQGSGTLVLLNNLDPSFTSYEVEDLVWHALNQKVEARMIEQSLTSNKYYGRALVIFKRKDAAESAISELNRRCLVLEDGRVVSAEKATLGELGKKTEFNGHLVIDRSALQKQRKEMRNAVSTSHCAQPNTIEYQMSVDWLMHYIKSDAAWKALFEKQNKEIEAAKSKLKVDRIFFKSHS